MAERLLRLEDRALGAPYFAEEASISRTGRYRTQDFFDVMLVIDGDGRQLSYHGPGEARVQLLHPGHLALYRPTDDLSVVAASPTGMRIRYVSFPVAEWQSFATTVGVDRAWLTSLDPPIVMTAVGDPAVHQPFDLAIERFRNHGGWLDLYQFWISLVPILFPASHSRVLGAGAPSWVGRSVDAMRQEDNLRVGLPRLLELAHVSSAHLSTTIRRYFDQTPSELVLEMRLRHAALLLATTNETVGGIAARCGFGSFPYFSTSFRHRYALTPRAYRARALGRFTERTR